MALFKIFRRKPQTDAESSKKVSYTDVLNENAW